MKRLFMVLSLMLLNGFAWGSADSGSSSSRRPAPTLANVHYGSHQRQVLDFWQVRTSTPASVVFFIHGGGWVRGDKSSVRDLEQYLAAGISVVAINYRYIQQAMEAGVTPPVQWPLQDAARALQFVRSNAARWNIDKSRIGATGSSAGACSSLWLAFHPDLADPKSSDPVARESTRLWCVAVMNAQTTLDPRQMFAWTPNSRYGGHAFGFWPAPRSLENGNGTRDMQFAEFLAKRDQFLPWIRKFSPMEHLSSDDPPIFLLYTKEPPALGRSQDDPTHTANFGIKLQDKLKAVGVACELVYPGSLEAKHREPKDFLIAKLARVARLP